MQIAISRGFPQVVDFWKSLAAAPWISSPFLMAVIFFMQPDAIGDYFRGERSITSHSNRMMDDRL